MLKNELILALDRNEDDDSGTGQFSKSYKLIIKSSQLRNNFIIRSSQEIVNKK